MASPANVTKSFFPAAHAAEQATARANRPEETRKAPLRDLPNEDIYFYVKRINNTRVVRQENPAQRATCWKTIGGVSLAALVLIGLLLPSTYSLLAGYQLHALQLEQQRLLNEKASLEVEEARLLSPERLEKMAQAQHFIDPPPGRVVVLNPRLDGSVAMNVRRGK